ncbi:mechanosensitive ion channel [Desulfosarcina sp. OttesenSCG-928-G10]|nr:mechanosensitive ion channel [Desulfosarcina sp. OttesenSCG-928-G10]
MSIHSAARSARISVVLILIFSAVFGVPDTAVFCAENDAQTSPPSAPALPPPGLSEVVYRVGGLSQRLISLKTTLSAMSSFTSLEHALGEAENQIQQFETALGAINADDLRSYQQLARLKKELRNLSETVALSTGALETDIQRIETERQTWNDEKTQWEQWHDLLKADLSLEGVAEAFSRAEADMADAHTLLSEKLGPLLGIHQKTGEIQARIDALETRINTMMTQRRGDNLKSDTPPLFSSAYVRQLIDLYSAPETLFNPLPLPESPFYREKGWVLILQVAVFGVLLTLLRRHRPVLLGHPIRRFLGTRPVSVALLVPVFTLTFLYGTPPALWQMGFQTLAGVTLARLTTAFVKEAWINRAIGILVLVLISFQALLALGIPMSLMRLFVLVWSGAGGIYYWRRLRLDSAGKEEMPAWRLWTLRLIVLLFVLIAITDIIGLSGFSIQVLSGSIGTALLMIMGWLMVRLSRVALEMGIEQLPMEGFNFLRNTANAILSRVLLVLKGGIGFFVAVNLLVVWNLYTLPSEAAATILALGFSAGGARITVGLVLVAGIILYSAFVLSWLVQRILMDKVFSRSHMDAGARLSIARLAHYGLIFIGFLIALAVMGVELKNITLIGGALGVGIGFGMQTLVNNFVSGLILLFERPIKVGDIIEVGGQTGRVTKMGLRATTVETFDRAEVVVPNGTLISNQLVNWTLGDRSKRLVIDVGVAYGSDMEAVIRILADVAANNEKVLKTPGPSVAFAKFGESSLDLQLRVWIADYNDGVSVKTALMLEIDRRFREAAIEIPFPQQDLHVRGMDEAVILQLNQLLSKLERTGDV